MCLAPNSNKPQENPPNAHCSSLQCAFRYHANTVGCGVTRSTHEGSHLNVRGTFDGRNRPIAVISARCSLRAQPYGCVYSEPTDAEGSEYTPLPYGCYLITLLRLFNCCAQYVCARLIMCTVSRAATLQMTRGTHRNEGCWHASCSFIALP